MTTNAIFFSKFGLLAAIANPPCSNFRRKSGVHFYGHLPNVAAKGIRALRDAVSSVFCFVTKAEMVGANATSIVAFGAFVKHTKSLGDWAVKENIADGVCGSDLGFCASHNASVNHSVSTVNTASPNPATSFGFNSDFGDESVIYGFGKFLRAKINGVNVRLHVIKFYLVICRALGVPTREGNFIMAQGGLMAT